MNHVIRQQHLQIEVNGSESDALALQSRLSGWCQDRLFPALERTLDRCVPSAEYWSLDRLEIDAGTVALERLEQDLSALVEQALEKALRAPPLAENYTVPISASCGVIQKSAIQHIEEAWIYFLKTGTLPWGFRLQEGEHLEQTLLQSWLENPSDQSSRATLNALQSANARKRLVRQFSETFLIRLLGRITPDLEKMMAVILQRLKNADLPADAARSFSACLWEAAFAARYDAGPFTETGIVRSAWQKLPVTMLRQSLLTDLLTQHWPEAAADVNLPSSLQKNQKTESPEPDEQTANKDRFARIKVSGHAKTAIEPLAETEQINLHPDSAEGLYIENAGEPVAEAEQANLHPDAANGLYIENSGLVLLHPFLPQFFQALNIADEGVIAQPERALCLLHFLTTGQTVAPEYELILPKILCNIPLETPVESDMALTGSEKEEAEALLEAIIRHWDILRNTSIDGLRGTFLLRRGKLSLRDDGDWLLQVESKSFDILLDQLPWGIGMIKLPWMQRMLWVEWSN
jgi:hypothetical protein